MSFPGDPQTTAGLSSSTDIRPTRPSPALLPALTLLLHPDLSRVGARAFLGESVAGDPVFLSRRQPHFLPPGKEWGRPLDDRFVSRTPLCLEPLAGGGFVLHRGDSRTPVQVNGAPVAESHALSAEVLERGVVLTLADRIVLLLHRTARPRKERPPDHGLVGESDAILGVRRAVQQVAEVDIPVLVTGETGTGKELVARALHRASGRGDGPFVAINLGALTPSLAAAELFGARKGAFTGAVQDRPGYFGRADLGTLFLDEIGEAPPEIQVMLLRALETGEVVPVGSQSPERPDVRIVAATDADLQALVRRGEMKAPLLHRLARYRIHMPPLRERREDLGLLLVHFLTEALEDLGEELPDDPDSRRPWLPAALVERFAAYPWPGNVRELRNLAHQLVIENRGHPRLSLAPETEEHLAKGEELAAPGDGGGSGGPPPRTASEEVPSPRRKPGDITEEELLAALRENRWEIQATARTLGIPRTSLYPLLDRFPGVRNPAEVPPEEIREAFHRHGGDLEALVDELEISSHALRRKLKDLGLR